VERNAAPDSQSAADGDPFLIAAVLLGLGVVLWFVTVGIMRISSQKASAQLLSAPLLSARLANRLQLIY
jgi:hypothetical protein